MNTIVSGPVTKVVTPCLIVSRVRFRPLPGSPLFSSNLALVIFVSKKTVQYTEGYETRDTGKLLIVRRGLTRSAMITVVKAEGNRYLGLLTLRLQVFATVENESQLIHCSTLLVHIHYDS